MWAVFICGLALIIVVFVIVFIVVRKNGSRGRGKGRRAWGGKKAVDYRKEFGKYAADDVIDASSSDPSLSSSDDVQLGPLDSSTV